MAFPVTGLEGLVLTPITMRGVISNPEEGGHPQKRHFFVPEHESFRAEFPLAATIGGHGGET